MSDATQSGAEGAGRIRTGGLGEAHRLLEGSRILIEDELCLNVRGRGEWCESCARQCPTEAISLALDGVDLDEQACVGCGSCAAVCPAGALRQSGFDPRRLVEAAASAERLVMHCRESRQGGGGVVVPCFRVLDARLLAALRGTGVRRVVACGVERCATCDRGGAESWLADVSATLADWLGTEAPTVVSVAEEDMAGGDSGPRHREDSPRLSRRHLLGLAAGRAAVATAGYLLPAATEDLQADPEDLLAGAVTGGAGEPRPHPRQGLLAELAQVIPWRTAAELPLRGRAITESCSACLACAERCPTGALSAATEDGACSIHYDPARCTDCGLCEAICPHQALRSRPLEDLSALQRPAARLLYAGLRRCQRCADLYRCDQHDAQLCPVCSNEQDLDDEWMAMLEG